jgi:hypothetical protein
MIAVPLRFVDEQSASRKAMSAVLRRSVLASRTVRDAAATGISPGLTIGLVSIAFAVFIIGATAFVISCYRWHQRVAEPAARKAQPAMTHEVSGAMTAGYGMPPPEQYPAATRATQMQQQRMYRAPPGYQQRPMTTQPMPHVRTVADDVRPATEPIYRGRQVFEENSAEQALYLQLTSDGTGSILPPATSSARCV